MILKNILKYFRVLFLSSNQKILYDYYIKNRCCFYCGKNIKGIRRRFCCDDCNNRYWNEVRKRKIKRDYPKILFNERLLIKELKRLHLIDCKEVLN